MELDMEGAGRISLRRTSMSRTAPNANNTWRN